MWTISSFFSKILSSIFPPHCYACGKADFSLCPSCLAHCQKAIETPALYITSLYSFHDPLIKKAIHAIKYFHRKDLISPLARELAKEMKNKNEELRTEDSLRESSVSRNWKLETKNSLLIPIPMPSLRKYMRGYNQADILAKELSKECNLPYDATTLVRIKSPRRQVTAKTRGERLKNQHNSFKVMKDVKNLNIILVDDVTTTGATLGEARNTLLKAGAKSVKAVTLAH